MQPSRKRRWILALASIGLAQACSSESEFRRGQDTRGGAPQRDSATADSQRPVDATGVSDQQTVPGKPDSNFADAGRPDTSAADTGLDSAIADARNDRAAQDSATPDSGIPDARTDATIGPNDCALVSCGTAGDRSCCADVYTFGLDAMDMPSSSIVTGFTVGASAVTARFRFDAPKQDGAIGMALTTPRVPTLVRLTATWTGPVGRPFLTLEGLGAGCAYAFGTNWEADLQNQLYCWGGSFTPDALSFRIESTAAGDASLTITRIEIR